MKASTFLIIALMLTACGERASRDAFLKPELTEGELGTIEQVRQQSGSGGVITKVACPLYVYESGSWVYTGGVRWIYAADASPAMTTAVGRTE